MVANFGENPIFLSFFMTSEMESSDSTSFHWRQIDPYFGSEDQVFPFAFYNWRLKLFCLYFLFFFCNGPPPPCMFYSSTYMIVCQLHTCMCALCCRWRPPSKNTHEKLSPNCTGNCNKLPIKDRCHLTDPGWLPKFRPPPFKFEVFNMFRVFWPSVSTSIYEDTMYMSSLRCTLI